MNARIVSAPLLQMSRGAPFCHLARKIKTTACTDALSAPESVFKLGRSLHVSPAKAINDKSVSSLNLFDCRVDSYPPEVSYVEHKINSYNLGESIQPPHNEGAHLFNTQLRGSQREVNAGSFGLGFFLRKPPGSQKEATVGDET